MPTSVFLSPAIGIRSSGGSIAIGPTMLASSGLNITSTVDDDFLNALVLGAGSTAQYKRYLNFINYNDNSTAWRLGANRTNDFIVYDNTSGLHAFLAASPSDGGTVTINGNGSGAIRFNYDTDIGASTGGIKVYGGTTTPVEWFRVDASGTTLYAGKVQTVNSADNNKALTTSVSNGGVASLKVTAAGIIALQSSANGQALYVREYTAQSPALSGASYTFTGSLPAGSLIIGVTCRVTTAITGATSFAVGDGTDVDRWGAAIAVTLGTTSTLADCTVTTPPIYATAGAVVLTAGGSNFTGGVVRLTTHYLSVAAATS